MAAKTKKVDWNPESGKFFDSRDGIEYRTKKFGTQVWMIDNIIRKGERLFSAKQAVKALPKGWRIPTRHDVIELENYIGETYGCTPVLALTQRMYYDSDQSKKGASGFVPGSFWYMQNNGVPNFIELGKFNKFGIGMTDPNEENDSDYGNAQVYAVWDGIPTNPDAKLNIKAQENFGTFVDARDGQSYKTVKFGDQEWLAENLRYKDCESGYTWAEFPDVIPEGWRIPTDEDLVKLNKFVAENYFFCGSSVFKKESGMVDSVGLASDKPDHWLIHRLKTGVIDIPSLEYTDLSTKRWPLRLMRDSSYSEEENQTFREAVFAIGKDVARTMGRPAEEAGEESLQIYMDHLRKIAEQHCNNGTFTDPRDGEVYKTITVDGRTWMAENLRYKCEGSFAYDDDEANAKRFGRLYTREATCQGELDEDRMSFRSFQGVAPEGWHIATPEEWKDLRDYAERMGVHSVSDAASAEDGWNYELEKKIVNDCCKNRAIYLAEAECTERLDVFGLGIKPSGFRTCDGKYVAMGASTAYHNFSRSSDCLESFGKNPEGWGIEGYDSAEAIPVRCVKNESYEEIFARNTRNSKEVFGEFMDERDGEKYHTVKVGNQVWMVEDLRYKTPNCKDKGYICEYTWADAMNVDPAFNEKPLSPEMRAEVQKGNCQGIAPKGWHIPTKKEFDALRESVKELNPVNMCMESAGIDRSFYWTSKDGDPEDCSECEAVYGSYSAPCFIPAPNYSTSSGMKSEFHALRCVKNMDEPIVDNFNSHCDI